MRANLFPSVQMGERCAFVVQLQENGTQFGFSIKCVFMIWFLAIELCCGVYTDAKSVTEAHSFLLLLSVHSTWTGLPNSYFSCVIIHQTLTF